jgi:UDP-N-acetylmuramoyl-L-alanyl-D-glutamate--2,6-diaminopimelate ligase
MMQLREITRGMNISSISGSTGLEVAGLRFDSREVGPGDLFFAIRGSASDGHDFIEKAIEKGAAAIVCETMPETIHPEICYIVTPNSHHALGVAAAAFYGNPSAHLKLVGITGTNGKTTIATLLYQLFLALGYGVGLISTIVNKINLREIPATFVSRRAWNTCGA